MGPNRCDLLYMASNGKTVSLLVRIAQARFKVRVAMALGRSDLIPGVTMEGRVNSKLAVALSPELYDHARFASLEIEALHTGWAHIPYWMRSKFEDH
jgi:hypothetical protein